MSAVCACSVDFGDGVVCTGICSEKGIDSSEERTPGDFSSLRTAGPFNVYYEQADETRILVEGKEEFVGALEADVVEGVLRLGLREGRYHNLVLRVTVFSPSLDAVHVGGSGQVFLDELETSSFDAKSSGSGRLHVGDLRCASLTLSSSGSGGFAIDEAQVGGNARMSISGSGSGRANGIICGDQLAVKVSGSGSMRAEVECDSINAATSGSGSIVLDGSCREVVARSSGSGSIRGDLEYERIQKSESGSGSVRL